MTTTMNGFRTVDRLVTPLPGPEAAPPQIEIVIPVYNEAATLERSVRRVLGYMGTRLPFRVQVTIADNASTDATAAIGTRLDRGSRVVRGPKRELISRTYNRILRLTLRTRFSDAKCGFKAVRRDAAAMLLPAVEDDKWFFDTELLVAAERAGLRIHEVPVDWVDDPDSSVDITATALDDLRGVWRIRRRGVGPRRRCLRAA
jgi:hypothetical protein